LLSNNISKTVKYEYKSKQFEGKIISVNNNILVIQDILDNSIKALKLDKIDDFTFETG